MAVLMPTSMPSVSTRAPPELAESFRLPSTSGAIIAGVMRGSPADKAGIVPGDVLLSVAGKPVKDAQSMLELIAGLPPGEAAKFRIRREGKDLELAGVIGKRPKPTFKAD